MSPAPFTLVLVLALSAGRCAGAESDSPDDGGPGHGESADVDAPATPAATPAATRCEERGGYVDSDDAFAPPAGAESIRREVILTCSKVSGSARGTIIRSQAELDAVLVDSRCEGPAPAVDFTTRAVTVISTSQPFSSVAWVAKHEDDSLEVGVSASAYCEGAAPPRPPLLLLAIPPEIQCVSVTSHSYGSCDEMHPKA